MGGSDLHTLIQALAADDCQQQHLTPVILIDLIAGLQLHTPDVGLEALGLRLSDTLYHAFPLGLAGIQKRLVALAVGVHSRPLALRHPIIAVLGLAEDLFLPFLVIHGTSLLYIFT